MYITLNSCTFEFELNSPIVLAQFVPPQPVHQLYWQTLSKGVNIVGIALQAGLAGTTSELCQDWDQAPISISDIGLGGIIKGSHPKFSCIQHHIYDSADNHLHLHLMFQFCSIYNSNYLHTTSETFSLHLHKTILQLIRAVLVFQSVLIHVLDKFLLS